MSPCSKHCIGISSLISILLSTFILIILIIILDYAYIENNNHLHEDKCKISNCTITSYVCGTNKICPGVIYYIYPLLTDNTSLPINQSYNLNNLNISNSSNSSSYVDQYETDMINYKNKIELWIVYIIIGTSILFVILLVSTIFLIIKWRLSC